MSIIKILNKQKYKQSQPTRSSLTFNYEHGSLITPDSSLEISAFYRGCSYIATQIGKLPWDVKTSNNELRNDTNLWFLLNRSPNSDMTAFNFRVLMVYMCLLRGNGYAEIVRNSIGKITALIPIINHDVCLIRDVNGDLFYQLSNTKDGGTVYLKPEEILHFKNLHTEDGINGMAVLNYAAKVLGISSGADRMAGSLFKNGGMPSGVLTTDQALSDPVITRLKEQWKEKFGGNKAGGVAVLEENLKFNPINFAPDVMQFLESRQFSVIEIARFLSVPPSKLYVPESQTYNNIEHSSLEVGNDTIDVWARNFESEVDMKLLASSRTMKTEMDLYAIFRGDMDTRAKYFSTMVGNGAMTPNQVRVKEGYAPYSEGDEYYISSNNLTPISRQNEIIDSQIKGKEKSAVVDEAIANRLSKRK